MPLAGGAYLFFLGLAGGLSLLTTTGYRRVSPAWLRWLLMASGLFVFSRYVALALFTSPDAPREFWAWRRCWLATSAGLTIPSVFAIDQLLRHPAVSPKQLLRWCAPFLAVYSLLIAFGQFAAAPDRVVGWTLQLSPGWQTLLALTQAVFVLGFIGLGLLLIRKIPSWPIRSALIGLVVAQGYLGLDGLLLAMGRWYFRPFLYSEMFALLALWYAYEVSASLQQST